MSEESESYRLQMLRRLKQIDRGPTPPKVLKAEKVVAEYREEQARARETIARASLPLPEINLCPQCWINHGHRTFLTANHHPSPDRYDRLICSQCNYVEDRDVTP